MLQQIQWWLSGDRVSLFWIECKKKTWWSFLSSYLDIIGDYNFRSDTDSISNESTIQ